ncbi:MAG: hypothetical protein ACXWP0_01130 [Ktedonobacterales bacterium]
MGHWDASDLGKQQYHISMADLAETLDTLPEDTRIDMIKSTACLGALTVARLLPEAQAVEYFYGYGTLMLEGEFTEVAGTTAVEDFIHLACDVQNGIKENALSVAELRGMLNVYINRMSVAADTF